MVESIPVQSDEVDTRQVRHTRVEGQIRPMRSGQAQHLAGGDPQHGAASPACEGSSAQRVGPGHAESRKRHTVEHHEHAHFPGGRVGGDPDGVGEVRRTVRRGIVRRPLRAGEHDRAWIVVGEVGEKSRLLHDVGAMGDHHAVRAFGERVADLFCPRSATPAVHPLRADQHPERS
jgi:hypothetical protein